MAGWSFDLEVLAHARAQEFRICEVAVRWANDARSNRASGSSPRSSGTCTAFASSFGRKREDQ